MNLKNRRGITLIALVVTIVVLIVIGGVSIGALTADNGVLRQTNAAKIDQIEATAREQVQLACAAMRLAVAEAHAKDNSYSAKENASLIQDKLIDVLNADKEGLEGEFSDGGSKAVDGKEKFKIVYVGDDYSNACNDSDAKITYTIGVQQKTVELLKETTSDLKDEEGNKVNTGIGEADVVDSNAGLYETGSNYSVLLKSWQELIDEEIVYVEDGVVNTNLDIDAWENASSDYLAGDLVLPNDGSITAIGNAVWDEDIGGYTGNFGFASCYSLTGIVIPDSVTIINDGAFGDCYSLTEITIPSTVETIGYDAFYYCQSLTSVTLNEGLVTIGENAFGSCYSLTEITIPSTVETIGYATFYGCESLTSIIINATDTSKITIMDYAFGECNNLEEITLSYAEEIAGHKIVWYINGYEAATGKVASINVSLDSMEITCEAIQIITSGYLVDIAKIGDYIDIGIDYENGGYDSNYTYYNYTNTNGPTGWRVLSTNGSGKDGTVTLVSAGTPMYYSQKSGIDFDVMQEQLADLNKEITLTESESGFYSIGIDGITAEDENKVDLAEIWSSHDTIDTSARIHAITSNEVETLYEDLTGISKTIEELSSNNKFFLTSEILKINPYLNTKAYDLLGIGMRYCLEDLTSGGYYFDIYYSNNASGRSDCSYGIRIVLTLNSGVEIDSANTGDGSSSTAAYIIK